MKSAGALTRRHNLTPSCISWAMSTSTRPAKCLRKKGRRGFWHTPEGTPYLNATGFADEIQAAKAEGYLPTIMRDHVASIFTIPWIDNVVGVNFGRISGRLALDPKMLTESEIIGREQLREGLRVSPALRSRF